MKTYVISFLFLFVSLAGFAQSGEVALGDTANVRATRGKFFGTSAGVPMFKVGLQPGKRLAYFSDIPSLNTLDGRYVQSGVVYPNPVFVGTLAYSKLFGAPTTASGYGITDVDTYQVVATYAAMNALSYATGTARRVLVTADEIYGKSNQWYMVWADSGGMHADKLVTISEK
jgi:hypothetical protein